MQLVVVRSSAGLVYISTNILHLKKVKENVNEKNMRDQQSMVIEVKKKEIKSLLVTKIKEVV